MWGLLLDSVLPLASKCGVFYLCARLEIKALSAADVKVNLEMIVRVTNKEEATKG